MKTAKLNASLIDSYFTLLKSLSPNHKLELIARLSMSMKTTKKLKDNSWMALFGSWDLDQSADEFVEELRSDRKFNRKTVDM